MSNYHSYDNIDKLRDRAYAGMVAMSYLRSVASRLDYIVAGYGMDFAKKYLTDIVDDYDNGNFTHRGDPW